MPAEAKGVDQRHIGFMRAGLIGYIVKVTFRVRRLIIDGGADVERMVLNFN